MQKFTKVELMVATCNILWPVHAMVAGEVTFSEVPHFHYEFAQHLNVETCLYMKLIHYD